MRKINKLENEIKELKTIIDFLKRNDRKDIKVEYNFGKVCDGYAEMCLEISYIYKGKFKICNKNIKNDYTFINIVINEEESAIFLFSNRYLLPNDRYFKFNKKTGDMVDITDQMPTKSDFEKAGETLLSAVSNLANIFEPKSDSKKKTTKKKESK